MYVCMYIYIYIYMYNIQQLTACGVVASPPPMAARGFTPARARGREVLRVHQMARLEGTQSVPT